MERIFTVASLIDALTRMPPDVRVVIEDADTGWALQRITVVRVHGRVVLRGCYDSAEIHPDKNPNTAKGLGQ